MTTQTLKLKTKGALGSSSKERKAPLSRALYYLTLIVVGAVLLFLIVVTKGRTAVNLKASPALLIYTLVVTTFELSRLVAAIFYNNRMHFRHFDKSFFTAIRNYEPTVSFVIPCYNEGPAIEKTVTKCFQADYPREKLEVIVINDGSTDNTLEVLYRLKKKFPDLIVIDFPENRGKRHGMAEGFKVSTGEIVVQLDSDSYIVPETFREIVEPFANPEVGAVCAHADPENADQNFLTKMQSAYYFLSFRIMKAAESAFFAVFCCSGCSSAYRRSVVMPIMDIWLKETFLGRPVTWGDDRALTNWVLKLGYKTMYTDRAKAFTICPDTLKKLLKQQVRWKKGWLVNSIFASKFIWKKQPFVAFTYFFPLIFVTLSTPLMATKALVFNPLFYHILPFYYMIGVFLIASLIVTFYRAVARENKYWPYVFAWSILNMFILSFILFYAIATIQNRKWGTR